MGLVPIFREWTLRLLGALRPHRRDSEIEEELQLHLEMEAEKARSHGASDEEARRLARIKMGHETQVMEELRDQRGLPWLEDLLRDLRQGVRALRRAPGYSAVVILTLALAGGANTAIFSIVNGVLLLPLDYPRPGQLMYMTSQLPRLGFRNSPYRSRSISNSGSSTAHFVRLEHFAAANLILSQAIAPRGFARPWWMRTC